MLHKLRAWMVAAVCVMGAWSPAHAGPLSDLLSLLGLIDESKIVRDNNGIPHIFANNEHDLVFMQGYAHAQDRLFQMDVLRRQAEGTLAELLGAGALGSDVQLRTFGLRRAAERSLPILSQETQQALAAYADGVNAYLTRNPGLPPEYAAIEITNFRPWTALDSLVVVKLIAFGLSFELTDLDRTTLLSQYLAAGNTQGFNGSALFFEDMNRLAPFNNAATVPDAANLPPGSTATVGMGVGMNGTLGNQVLMDLAAAYSSLIKTLPFVQSVIHSPDDDRGSNEFVIAGNLSSTGKPIVANDPHLQLTAPAQFYQNRLKAPGFDVVGDTIVGIPYVISGHNDRIVWGVTTHLIDVTDVYQERIVPDPNSPSGLSTVYLGNLEPVVALPQVFRANSIGDGVQNSVNVVPAGGAIPAAVLIVPRRNQGPIIALNQAAGTAISVQYAGFSGTREIQAFRGLSRATNMNQFTAALQAFDVGSQNFAYADTSGNIAYFSSGEVPLREDLQAGAVNGMPPFLIRNGQGGNEWLAPPPGNDPNRALPYAILPTDEMPRSINPPRGLLVNANNDPTGNNRDNNVLNTLRPGGGILYLNTGFSVDLGIRAGRIEALFAPTVAGGPKLSAQDLQRFQSDVVMGDAQFFTPFIVQALTNAQRPGAPAELAALAADPRVQEAISRLAAWDQSTPSGIVEGFDAADQNGQRSAPSQAEINHSVATTIYSVWRNQFVTQVLATTLARRGLALTNPRDQQLNALKNLFDTFATRQGVGASGVDFFDVPGVVLAQDRRDIVMLRSLTVALNLLASPTFADAFAGSTSQSDYRWGRLHRVVLAHPLGGPFSTPPAGGAFPQPLPNLPGIPTDGGLYTVDVANHVLNRDLSNGFMFTSGPIRRFVGSVNGSSVNAVSSLVGGESGVPGNEFNVNLLPRYLTNEAYTLETDILNLPDLISRIDVFKPLLGGILGPLVPR